MAGWYAYEYMSADKTRAQGLTTHLMLLGRNIDYCNHCNYCNYSMINNQMIRIRQIKGNNIQQKKIANKRVSTS